MGDKVDMLIAIFAAIGIAVIIYGISAACILIPKYIADIITAARIREEAIIWLLLNLLAK